MQVKLENRLDDLPRNVRLILQKADRLIDFYRSANHSGPDCIHLFPKDYMKLRYILPDYGMDISTVSYRGFSIKKGPK